MVLPNPLELKPTPEDVGSEWLWWHVEKRRWRRVEIAEVPEGRAKRVKVQHLDPDMEGRAQWSPIGRCVTHWEKRDNYLDHDERIARALSHPFHRDTRDAAIIVFLEVVPDPVASLGVLPGGALEVYRPEELAAISGLPETNILAHPDTYKSEESWIVPWPTGETIAAAIASSNGPRLLRKLERERVDAPKRTEELIDRLVSEGREHLQFMSEEDKLDLTRRALERDAGKRAILMRWAGGADPTLAQEHERLQRRYVELRELAGAAVPHLDRRGASKSAITLAQRLKEAVDEIV